MILAPHVSGALLTINTAGCTRFISEGPLDIAAALWHPFYKLLFDLSLFYSLLTINPLSSAHRRGGL